MSLKGNNFFHMVSVGTALKAQSVTNTTAVGEAIINPWKTARQIAFLCNQGAFAATVDGSYTFEQRLRSDGATWSAIVEDDGSTPLIIDAVDDTTAFEGASVVATLDLSRIDGETYDAIRISFVEAGNAAALVSVTYALFDLYTHPSGQADQIFNKMDGDSATT